MSPNKKTKGAAGACEPPAGTDADTPVSSRSKKRRVSTDDDDDDGGPSKKVFTPACTSKLGFNGLRSPGSMQSHNKPAELFRKDLISAMKLADSETLPQDSYILISDPWKQEWEKGVQVPVNQSEIPNVVIKKQLDKPTSGDFKLKNPKKMLHAFQDEVYRQGIHELTGMHQLAEQVVRYDLDDLDVCWLQRANEDREEIGQTLIHEWTLERIIEAFENQCHESMHNMIKTEEGLGIEYDENIVCEVCKSPDSEDSNEMVFCDGCDICVHQACYGIQSIPEGSWLCRSCALGFKPRCILCPKSGGAMKSTKSGTKWAHVSCALWIPEVSIGCAEKMEPITKISMIPASRWALICCLCKERYGACIQCSVKTCKTSFHVTCGFQNNLSMKTILDDTEEPDGVKLKAYCPKHTKKLESSQSDSDSDSPRKEGFGTPRKDMTKEELANLRAKKIKELEAEFYTVVDVAKVSEALGVEEEIVELVLFYWKLKRKANLDKPLLMPKTEEADLLERQQEDSLLARMKMFVHLRQDLERVRNLCYMISRREKLKRQYYRSREQAFKAAVRVLNNDGLKLTVRECEKTADRYNSNSLYEGHGQQEPPVLKPMRPLKLSDIRRNLGRCKSPYPSDSESQHSDSAYVPGRCVRSASKSSSGSRSAKDEIPVLEPEIPLRTTDLQTEDVDVVGLEPSDEVPEIVRSVTVERVVTAERVVRGVTVERVVRGVTVERVGSGVTLDRVGSGVTAERVGRVGRPRRRRRRRPEKSSDMSECEASDPSRTSDCKMQTLERMDVVVKVESDSSAKPNREARNYAIQKSTRSSEKEIVVKSEPGSFVVKSEPEIADESAPAMEMFDTHSTGMDSGTKGANDAPNGTDSGSAPLKDASDISEDTGTSPKGACSPKDTSSPSKGTHRGKHRRKRKHKEMLHREERNLRRSHKDRHGNENHPEESKPDLNITAPMVRSPRHPVSDVQKEKTLLENPVVSVSATPDKQVNNNKERRSNRQAILSKSDGKVKIERRQSVQPISLSSMYIVENAIKQRVQNKLLKSRKSRFLNGLHDRSFRKIDSIFQLRSQTNGSPLRSSPSDDQAGRILNEIPLGIGKSAFEQNKLFGEQCLSKEHRGFTTPQKAVGGARTPQSGRGAGEMLKDLKAIILEEGIGSPETRSVRRRIEAVFDIDVKKNIFTEAGLDEISAKFCNDEFKNVELVTDSRGYRSRSPPSSETDSSCVSLRSRESTPRRVTRSHGPDTDENSLDSVHSLRNTTKLRLRDGWLRASNFTS